MGSSSRNTHERNERKRKGKAPVTKQVSSSNSKSPPTSRSGWIHIGPRNQPARKEPTHRELSTVAINKKLRRFLEFSEASSQSQSTDVTLKEKEEKIEKNIKLFYEGLVEVDRVLAKVVSNFSPEIQRQILESPSTKKAKKEPSTKICSSDDSIQFITHIHVLVYNGTPYDEGVWYEMNPGDRFKHIYEDYAAKLDTTTDKIMLYCLRCDITPEATAESSGVQDGARIGVKGTEDYNFNTDTHVKQITYVQTVDKEVIKYTTTFAPTDKMIEVYYRWAEYAAGYKYNEFFLLHEHIELPRVGTVVDYPIKNGSILFCGKYLAHQIWGSVDPSESF